MQEFTLRMHHDRNQLVVHNQRLAVPTDPYAQALSRKTAKSKRTIEEHESIGRTEWEGALYYDDTLGPYVPVSYPTTSLWQSAKLTKDGERLRRALTLMGPDNEDRVPIEYDGPRDLEGLWDEPDGRFRLVMSLKQGTARVMRTRPCFPPPWTITSHGVLDEAEMNPSVFEEIAIRAGRLIGIGTKVSGFRCRYYVDLEWGAAK